MRAGRRRLGALLLLAVVAAACSSSPSQPTAHKAQLPASVWPTQAQANACATGSPSDWMRCLEQAHPAFADVPLSYVALPGAENAGTFNLDPQAFDNQAGSACTTISPGLTLDGTRTQRFSATQDETITRQLQGGVRWIDLRVGYNGGGNPVSGWRVTQNLYSNWPLSEYLDEVANWAWFHPTEAVVVDLSAICYDHHPTAEVDKGLWANFATKSVEGAGPLTLADVAARPSSFGGSLASATLRQLGEARHNVVVLIPATARDWQILETNDHIEPVRTVPPGHSTRGTTEVEHSDPRVAPAGPAEFTTANSDLASFPTAADPPLGSLHGKGVYVSKLAYELKGAPAATQKQIVSSFVGLVASEGGFPAWMSGLWKGQYGQILQHWGGATNVVLGDGVDLGGFTAAVIERNGR
ncbi:MAG: PI-PLC domain-containing protein [Acidimicrobiales bacterium]